MQLGKRLATIYIAIFLVVLTLPTIGTFLGVTTPQIGNSEWRVLSKFPKISPQLSFSDFSKAFETFINDNFGFRGWLLEAYADIKFILFQGAIDPTNIIGKNDMIFYEPVNTEDYKTSYLHIQFTTKELEAFANLLTAERDWFKARGIGYLIVIVPDKDEVYPENYPFSGNHILKFRTEQFINYLKNHTDLDVIYLKQALLEAKKEAVPLYYSSDTHWSNYGAFFGYQEIMKYIKKQYPEVQPLGIDDFDVTVSENDKHEGDLGRIGFNLKDKKDLKVNVTLKDPTKNLYKLPRLDMYGDSFASNKPDGINEVGLNYFFKFNFTEIENTAFSYKLDLEDIEKNRPQFMIRETVQRKLPELMNAF